MESPREDLLEELQPTLTRLNSLLNDCSNELPERFIQGPESQGYKFAGKWFNALYSHITFLVKFFSINGVIDLELDKLRIDVAAFAQARRAKVDFCYAQKCECRTSREEIEAGDELIARALRIAERLTESN